MNPHPCSRALLVLLSLALAGCPGSTRFPRKDRGQDGYWPIPDIGKPGKKDGGAAHDSGRADAKLTTKVGGPCPCAAPLLCVLEACRNPCQKEACNGQSTCDPAEACINTEINTPVCVPGVATGQECTSKLFCQAGNLCLTTDPGGTKGKCYATCTTEGAACGGGGTCSQAPQGCLACL